MSNLPEGSSFKFVYGNTGGAVYYESTGDASISTRNISELGSVTSTASEINAGAAVSISMLMKALESAQTQTGFEYLSEILSHWQKVASTSVRNVRILTILSCRINIPNGDLNGNTNGNDLF